MDFTYEMEQVEFKKSTAELKEGIISLAAIWIRNIIKNGFMLKPVFL